MGWWQWLLLGLALWLLASMVTALALARILKEEP
jgi:hypothetical protein